MNVRFWLRIQPVVEKLFVRNRCIADVGAAKMSGSNGSIGCVANFDKRPPELFCPDFSVEIVERQQWEVELSLK